MSDIPESISGRSEFPPPSGDARQLALPLDGVARVRARRTLPRSQRVFVNRSLRMAEVDWIGFDMDYTLAVYVQHEMDRLQIAATLPKLIERGYPSSLLGAHYELDFPVRGLLIDKQLGNVVKMDLHKVVRRARHGTRELSPDTIRTLYNEHRTKTQNIRFQWVDTLYAVTEVTLYSTIIDLLEASGVTPDYERLFKDIRECIDGVHANGSVGAVAMKDFPRFVARDPKLPATLMRWKECGKKLFLLTNSHWPYSNAMMTYLLGDGSPDAPSWRSYFDAVFVAARKPSFFQGDAPLMIRDGDRAVAATGPLDPNAIYEGGNLGVLQALLGVPGDRVLYVGDHIYGDMLRTKKDSAWRTALVLQELPEEIHAHLASEDDYEQLEQLEDVRRRTEEDLVAWNARLVELTLLADSGASFDLAAPSSRSGSIPPSSGPLSLKIGPNASTSEIEHERVRLRSNVETCDHTLRRLDQQIGEIEARIDSRFHPTWGPMLREGAGLTIFSKQVEEYACLYTSKVSNFLAYAPQQHFSGVRERMPHEL